MIQKSKRQGRPPLKKGEARNIYKAVVLNREDVKKLAVVRKSIGGRSVSNTFRTLLLNQFDSIVKLTKTDINA